VAILTYVHLLLSASKKKKTIGVVSGEGIGWVAVHAPAFVCAQQSGSRVVL
jgi:hypothetical protein